LFGHEKGAFTGAVARRIGKFEEANGGTLLLDEISEMDARLQAKLLRAIQERVIDRVGGAKPVPVNIRIIATSNRDLAQAVREGEFRQDLLYRLNVVNLRVPALRERRKDLPNLAQFFIEKYAAANGRPCRRLGAEALASVMAHPWRGNVRELENAMHRAVLLSNDAEIGPAAIRAPDGAPVNEAGEEATRHAADAASRAMVGRTVAEVEQGLILETLTHCLGNRTHAANILGISIRTLRNKLKQYSDEGVAVPPPAFGTAA
jgi:DNA-binding NtrC family response regulator